MTSARKIAANRRNGKKSNGPRSAAGRTRASRNALRHGLSTIDRHAARFAAQIEGHARDICGAVRDPELFEWALVIAECDVVLRGVCAEIIAAIERMENGDALPLAKRMSSVIGLIDRKLKQRVTAARHLEALNQDVRNGLTSEPHMLPFHSRLPRIRGECHAFRAAMPDIAGLGRYQQRAWTKRRRALREFVRRMNDLQP